MANEFSLSLRAPRERAGVRGKWLSKVEVGVPIHRPWLPFGYRILELLWMSWMLIVDVF